ncbi:substrate-binding domain-containing protein, partial [bacterium]|nr:substrate-binding domain-containing protein [bacterium]
INGVETDLVATDNFKGGYIGTKYLISLRCKKIAFISGWLSLYSSEGRLSGYQKALTEENIPYRKELVIDGDVSEKFGYEAAKLLLTKNKIDGIFSANEPITIGILKAIKEMKIKPEEIKIVSFDEPNIPPSLNYPVTLIKQPRYEIGKIAAQILLERIKEKRRNLKTPFKKILLEPEMAKEKEEIKI